MPPRSATQCQHFISSTAADDAPSVVKCFIRWWRGYDEGMDGWYTFLPCGLKPLLLLSCDYRPAAVVVACVCVSCILSPRRFFFLATALCSVCVFFMCSFLVVRCSCPLFLFLLFFQCIYFYCTTRVCVCAHSIASFFCSCVLSFSEQLQQHSTHTHIERKRQTL